MKKRTKLLKLASILTLTSLPFISSSCEFIFNDSKEENEKPEIETKPKNPIKQEDPVKPTDVPTQPERPDKPVDEPQKPEEIVTPENPVEPDKPTDVPTKPEEPVDLEPIKPVIPEEPIDSVEPVEPADPKEPIISDEPVKPNPVKPTEIDEKEDANKKIVEELKEEADLKLDKFIGKEKINRLGASSSRKIEAIARKSETLAARLRQTTNDVYEKYANPSDARYKTNLEHYENFLNNFLTYYSRLEEFGKTGMLEENVGILAEFIDLYNKIDQANNYREKQIYENHILNGITITVGNEQPNFYEYKFDQISEYLDVVNKDLSLVFDYDDRYIVDFEKLDFLNPDKIGKVSSWLTKEQIIEYRKKLLYEGKLAENVKFDYAPNDQFLDNANWADLVYDITGGSNYYNDDVTPRYSYFVPETFDYKSYGFDIEYRTNPTEQQKQETELNDFVVKKIGDIISVKMTDEQKVTAVHNWIVDSMDYATNSYLQLAENDKKYWVREIRNPYRFISNPNTATIVCEAYARMFQRFMTFLDIPSWYISGPARSGNREELHAWNMVLINGKQYYVDCTWDDPTIPYSVNEHNLIHKSIWPHRYDYVLKTWEEIAGPNSEYRSIDKETIGLYYLRKFKRGKDFWDIEYLRSYNGIRDFNEVKSQFE